MGSTQYFLRKLKQATVYDQNVKTKFWLRFSPYERLSPRLNLHALSLLTTRTGIFSWPKIFYCTIYVLSFLLNDLCFKFLLNDLCFRPHSTSGCFQTGYIVNGEPKFVKSTFCPDSVLAGRTWT